MLGRGNGRLVVARLPTRLKYEYVLCSSDKMDRILKLDVRLIVRMAQTGLILHLLTYFAVCEFTLCLTERQGLTLETT
jgi:hypothetical protein